MLFLQSILLIYLYIIKCIPGEDSEVGIVAPSTDNCPYAFKHCCTGHCRQNGAYHPNATNIWFQNFGGDPWPAFQSLIALIKQHNMGCSLFFAGDSMMSDTLMAASCELFRHGYTLDSCVGSIGLDLYTTDEPVLRNCSLEGNMRGGSMQFGAIMRLRNADDDICPIFNLVLVSPDVSARKLVNNIFLEKQLIMNANDNVDRHSSGIGRVLLMNWGVHCLEADCLQRYMVNLAPQIYALQKAGYRVMWKESEAMHNIYPNKERDRGGLLIAEELNGNQQSSARSASDAQLQQQGQEQQQQEACNANLDYNTANWRNVLVERYLKQHFRNNIVSYTDIKTGGAKVRPVIPIIPYFNFSFHQHWNHPTDTVTVVDCLHFCYTRGRFTPLWEGVHNALKLMLE